MPTKIELMKKIRGLEENVLELKYKIDSHLEISRLIMKTAIIAIRDGMDVEDCFPLPDFDSYKYMVETKLVEYNKDKN